MYHDFTSHYAFTHAKPRHYRQSVSINSQFIAHTTLVLWAMSSLVNMMGTSFCGQFCFRAQRSLKHDEINATFYIYIGVNNNALKNYERINQNANDKTVLRVPVILTKFSQTARVAYRFPFEDNNQQFVTVLHQVETHCLPLLEDLSAKFGMSSPL